MRAPDNVEAVDRLEIDQPLKHARRHKPKLKLATVVSDGPTLAANAWTNTSVDWNTREAEEVAEIAALIEDQTLFRFDPPHMPLTKSPIPSNSQHSILAHAFDFDSNGPFEQNGDVAFGMDCKPKVRRKIENALNSTESPTLRKSDSRWIARATRTALLLFVAGQAISLWSFGIGLRWGVAAGMITTAIAFSIAIFGASYCAEQTRPLKNR